MSSVSALSVTNSRMGHYYVMSSKSMEARAAYHLLTKRAYGMDNMTVTETGFW